MSIAPTHLADRPFAELARWSGVTLVGLLSVLASGLAIGYLIGGASREPLSASALLIVAILVATAAAIARWLCAAAGPSRVVAWAPLPILVLLGAALSARGASTAGLLGLWTVLALEEAAFGLAAVRRGLGRSRIRRFGGSAAFLRADPPSLPAPHVAVGVAPPAVEAEAGPADPQCVQRLVRLAAPDGSQRISGWLRVDLEPGQRTATAHAAFCPPLDHAPTIDVEQCSGPSARVKVGQCLPQGVRFDVKLARPVTEPSSVVLRFSAASDAPKRGQNYYW